jgi:hypothetical protein
MTPKPTEDVKPPAGSKAESKSPTDRPLDGVVNAFTRAMPTVARAVNAILGVDIVTFAEKPGGGVVVITSQGQKFTFTAEQIDDPQATKQQFKRDKIKVFKKLPHGRIRTEQPEPEEE